MTVPLSSFLTLSSLLWTGTHGLREQRPLAAPVGTECKAAPGTKAWPSQGSWAAFNESIGGQLIRPAPPGGVCHPGQDTYDPDQCAVVAQQWTAYDFHDDDPVSIMWNQYANDTCLPDQHTPCSPAGYPAYVVNASTPELVKQSLDFARETNVRVTVKSSGHDYQGRSTAPGSLSIWVYHMQWADTFDSFSPQGCDFAIEQPGVTVGGGSQMMFLYEELDKIGRTVVGSGSKTVSVGGYVTGGGHSILAPRYGLAADQVWEVEIVTPMGDIVTANECKNQDLFWAVRGGGGSTFGVITAMTMATHPTPKIAGIDVTIVTPDIEEPYMWEMIGDVLSHWPSLDSQGLSGYGAITPNMTFPLGNGSSMDIGGVVGGFIVLDTEDPDDVLSLWQPIFEHVKKTYPAVFVEAKTSLYSSFLDWFNINYDQMLAGSNGYAGSHLLDANAMKDPKALSEAYREFAQIGGSAFMVSGDGVRHAKPRGGCNSVNPGWRSSVSHATTGVGFAPLSDPSAKAQALADLNAKIEPLRRLAPGLGSYVNENNPEEPDWQHSFWGSNYERLAEIKKSLDPLDVMWCHPCVGNEGWEEVGYQLCRV